MLLAESSPKVTNIERFYSEFKKIQRVETRLIQIH